jgi:hypothetical protein
MPDETPKTRKDFEAALIARAWKNEEFKKRLLSNPKEVIEEEIAKMGGGHLPADMEVRILTEDPKHIYIVLPQNPRKMDPGLTDEQLDGMSGGTVSVNVNVNLSVTVGVA